MSCAHLRKSRNHLGWNGCAIVGREFAVVLFSHKAEWWGCDDQVETLGFLFFEVLAGVGQHDGAVSCLVVGGEQPISSRACISITGMVSAWYPRAASPRLARGPYPSVLGVRVLTSPSIPVCTINL